MGKSGMEKFEEAVEMREEAPVKGLEVFGEGYWLLSSS